MASGSTRFGAIDEDDDDNDDDDNDDDDDVEDVEAVPSASSRTHTHRVDPSLSRRSRRRMKAPLRLTRAGDGRGGAVGSSSGRVGVGGFRAGKGNDVKRPQPVKGTSMIRNAVSECYVWR